LVAGIVLAILVLLPFTPGLKFYYLQVAILVFWFATLGTAWGISGGYGGQHSVGNAAFVGVGAYSSTLLFVNYEVSPWVGMFVGIALSGLLALLIGYPVFRFGLRGDYFTLATVAFGLLVFEIGQGATWLTGGSQGIPISYVDDPLLFQFADRRWFYFIIMALWLLTMYISYRIRRSRFGFQVLAVREDESAAARGGVNVLRTKLTAFAITAMITSVAGTFYAQFFLFIDPGAVIGLTLSVQIIVISALGGMGTFLGGTLGALILVPASQYLAIEFSGIPGLDLLLYGLILVLIMMYMPYGLLGTLRKNPKWRKIIAW
jgi:branched-chain amino acid transport system permease protein